ncbi:MAG: DnaD domain protein [Clostridiales bacterium]|nr:DnaD domain protein [Clostridiales bacterium]
MQVFFFREVNMFARLSKEKNMFRHVQLDNLFVTEYMPYAPESYVKVYIAGLSMAFSEESTLDGLATMLGLDKATIMEAYAYWAEQGIINVLSSEPPVVEYLEVKPLSSQVKKYSKAKYESFNNQLHAMLPSRTILPSEYNEYYSVMEIFHIDLGAMLAIIQYCVRLKGESIGYPYILAVAKNLASQGITTEERVNEKLSELALYEKELTAILKALGSKKSPDHNDSQLYVKWTKTLGFTPEVVIHVAKELKKGGMERLDGKLTKYYENHVFSISEIEEYNANRDRQYALTKEINRILGIYIEQLDYTIETYITKWQAFGFSDDTLVLIAKYCYAHEMRSLSVMDETVKRFYKQGLLSESSINSFMNEAVSIDGEIRALLTLAGVTRNVTTWDRDFYHTWTYSWKMPEAVIQYAATLAVGKGNAMAYINSILASWHERNVKTVDEAKKHSVAQPKEKQSTVTQKSAEELNSLFAHLNPEDI